MVAICLILLVFVASCMVDNIAIKNEKALLNKTGKSFSKN